MNFKLERTDAQQVAVAQEMRLTKGIVHKSVVVAPGAQTWALSAEHNQAMDRPYGIDAQTDIATHGRANNGDGILQRPARPLLTAAAHSQFGVMRHGGRRFHVRWLSRVGKCPSSASAVGVNKLEDRDEPNGSRA